jgi:hypothetical protein
MIYLDHCPIKAAQALNDCDLKEQADFIAVSLSTWAARYDRYEIPYGIPWTGVVPRNATVSWLLAGLGNVKWSVQYLYHMELEKKYRFGEWNQQHVDICMQISPWLDHFVFINNTCPPHSVLQVREKIMWATRKDYKGGIYTERKPPNWSFPVVIPEEKIVAPNNLTTKSMECIVYKKDEISAKTLKVPA